MINGRMLMEFNRIKRQIDVQGDVYEIYRMIKDNYGEDTEQFEQVCLLKGLFHQTKGYIVQKVATESLITSKGNPKILCCTNETELINKGDFVLINGERYNVVEKNDIQCYGMVTDISLDVVQK